MSPMTSAGDPFLPRSEPARTLYLAFQAEAKHRKERTGAEWIEAERKAVWSAACGYAEEHGLPAPTMEQVERAERYAMGSVDYGAKWAYALATSMTRTEVRS